MATIFSHALIAAAIKTSFGNFKEYNRKIWQWCLLCSIIPDFDVIAFSFGIPYEHVLGHRGFTHSILFAVLLGFALAFIEFRKLPLKLRLKIWLILFLCTMSHTILDAFTNGGLGVGLFIPFDNGRYFAPWTPIQVSPIGRNFFSHAGIVTLISEFKTILLPVVTLFIGKFLFKKFSNRDQQKDHK